MNNEWPGSTGRRVEVKGNEMMDGIEEAGKKDERKGEARQIRKANQTKEHNAIVAARADGSDEQNPTD